MALKCSRCAAEIPNEAVNLDLMLAECPACRHIQQLGTVGDGPRDPTRPQLADLPVPEGVDVAEGPNDLVITYAWWHVRYLAQLAFCVLWNGFMLMWFTIAAAEGEAQMGLFGLIHAAVGIGLAYGAIAGLCNRTTITARADSLTIAHGPVPWLGGRSLARADITQLYCVEHVKRTKNSTQVTWSVDAVDRDHRAVTLLSGVTDLAQARFFEKRVERYLGVADRPIAVEAPPSSH